MIELVISTGILAFVLVAGVSSYSSFKKAILATEAKRAEIYALQTIYETISREVWQADKIIKKDDKKVQFDIGGVEDNLAYSDNQTDNQLTLNGRRITNENTRLDNFWFFVADDGRFLQTTFKLVVLDKGVEKASFDKVSFVVALRK